MSAEERLEMVGSFVRDELDMSRDMEEHFRKKGDKERAKWWRERYDTLYSVLLRIVD